MSADTSKKSHHPNDGDPTPQLLRLMELAAQYPDIGPPLAELAFKVGKSEIGKRVVRMGLDADTRRVEYYSVLAHSARREGRQQDVMTAALDALDSFRAAEAEAMPEGDWARLLSLLRMGFATLLFDTEDFKAHPTYPSRLREVLPGLEAQLKDDALYWVLLAQAQWFENREQAEATWDRAAQTDSAEMVWNARGTWYKEAERNEDGAEKAYREGLKVAPTSALLLHNIAQLQVDRATREGVDVNEARSLLDRAENHLRAALRDDSTKLRRHIHATRDRLYDARRKLPKPPSRRDGTDNRGRDNRPRDNRGRDNRPRDNRGRDNRQRDNRSRDDRTEAANQRPQDFAHSGKLSLGDVLLAKLEEKKK